jgi:hypothetical protein
VELKGNLNVRGSVSIGGTQFRTFSTVTAAEAATGVEGDVAYVPELAVWFQYAAVSTAVVDHINVLATGDGGTSRWLKSSGVSAADISYTNSNASVISVGGITAGSTFDELTFPQMMDLMLYPELFPTLTNPSNTFSLTQAGLQEIGATINLNFSATFSRGTISPAYGTSGYRSGLPSQYGYTGTGLTSNPSSALTDSQSVTGYTVVSGAQSWTSSVTYLGGEQPLSSKGNNYSTPLAPGTTGSTTRTITGVYPTYATTASISTMTAQTLLAHGSQKDTSMVAESGGDKQSVEFPTVWGTITILQQYNTLSSTWDAINLATFTVTTINKTINGATVEYKKYTHNGATVGARQLRWRVS